MLKERSTEIEIMDDLEISGPVVDQTLKELNTINKTLGGNQISISAFKRIAKGQQQLTLADLGCGGGDIMLQIAKWCRRARIKLSCLGVDANPNIIAYAKENTKSHQEISYQPLNIFSQEFQQMKFDIVHCCLFLHHFTDEQLIKIFKTLKSQANIGVIINDLHRHPVAYWSIKALTYVFSRSTMVRNDAAVSVARGFKRSELIRILEQAGIQNFDLSWRWAFRWRLTF
ncbi:MAG: methyltransferase domain-containing protein [Bacteroidota bacterium]